MLKEAVLILGVATVVVLGQEKLPVTNDVVYKYYYFATPLNYKEADEACEAKSGELIGVQDEKGAQIQEYIANQNPCVPAWSTMFDHISHFHCYQFKCEKGPLTVKQSEVKCKGEKGKTRPYVCKINAGVSDVGGVELPFTHNMKYSYEYYSTPVDYASAQKTCEGKTGSLITFPDKKLPEIIDAIAVLDKGKPCDDKFALKLDHTGHSHCQVIKCDNKMTSLKQSEVECKGTAGVKKFVEQKRGFVCKIAA